jgi:cytochrome c
MRLWFALALAGAVMASGAPALAADGDPAKGEVVFKKCMTCHRIGEGAKNATGPVLNGVIGRQAGTAPDFKYSTLNHDAGENGLVWTEENIYAYLPDPTAFLKKFLTDAGKPDLAKGTTKMAFKLPKEQDRLDVIAYIKQFSPPPAQ